MDTTLLNSIVWTRTLTLQRANNGDDITVNYISQEYVGLDVHLNLTIKYTDPRYTTNSKQGSQSQSKLQAFMKSVKPVGGISVKSSRPESSDDIDWSPSATQGNTQDARKACNHKCVNKRACGHPCCKNGVAVKQSSKSRPEKRQLIMSGTTPKNQKTMDAFLSQLHTRANCMPMAPQIKRTRVDTGNHEGAQKSLKKFTFKRKSQIPPLHSAKLSALQTGDDAPTPNMPTIQLDKTVTATSCISAIPKPRGIQNALLTNTDTLFTAGLGQRDLASHGTGLTPTSVSLYGTGQTDGRNLAPRGGRGLAQTGGRGLAQTVGRGLAQTDSRDLTQTDSRDLAQTDGFGLAHTGLALTSSTGGAGLAQAGGRELVQSGGTKASGLAQRVGTELVQPCVTQDTGLVQPVGTGLSQQCGTRDTSGLIQPGGTGLSDTSGRGLVQTSGIGLAQKVVASHGAGCYNTPARRYGSTSGCPATPARGWEHLDVYQLNRSKLPYSLTCESDNEDLFDDLPDVEGISNLVTSKQTYNPPKAQRRLILDVEENKQILTPSEKVLPTGPTAQERLLQSGNIFRNTSFKDSSWSFSRQTNTTEEIKTAAHDDIQVIEQPTDIFNLSYSDEDFYASEGSCCGMADGLVAERELSEVPNIQLPIAAVGCVTRTCDSVNMPEELPIILSSSSSDEDVYNFEGSPALAGASGVAGNELPFEQKMESTTFCRHIDENFSPEVGAGDATQLSPDFVFHHQQQKSKIKIGNDADDAKHSPVHQISLMSFFNKSNSFPEVGAGDAKQLSPDFVFHHQQQKSKMKIGNDADDAKHSPVHQISLMSFFNKSNSLNSRKISEAGNEFNSIFDDIF
ncbi:uncharacterized protein LOC117120246 [Anneissia japonica]|uniref:uncharacterized protein LOC117120246 n=1 Tax=Anneissia japonica TaxID=1529436 RepID=UPI00142556A7|nr:uncharacterized protein LOC117120246 [Anneissia japonica]